MKRTAYTLAAAAMLFAAPAFAGSEPVVGQPAPDFTLTDEKGTQHSLGKYKGSVVVLEWTNPGCPFVKRHYKTKPTMKTTAEKFGGKKVVWLAINSTASNTPADSKKWIDEQKLGYVTLQDADGTVGKTYGARTTPHMFVIDAKGVLRYAGAIDDDPSGKNAAPKNYVDDAVTALLAGKEVAVATSEPYGCSVKYKSK
jgi:peroxiredoxin